MKKLVSVITAVAAAAALTTAALAYDMNKDLGKGWSASITVLGEEFTDVTAETPVTITITVDESLAEVEGQNYWCVKPMINSPEGWAFIDNISQLTLSEGKDSYVFDTDATEMVFTWPADKIDEIKEFGVAFMGHGITLGTMTFGEDGTLVEAPAEDTAEEAPAADTTADAGDKTTGNPETGVEGVAAVAALGITAMGAAFISRKRK
ncbi:MAG: hypothetical protein ACI4J1_06385 [Ruminiclostridium sp.]